MLSLVLMSSLALTSQARLLSSEDAPVTGGSVAAPSQAITEELHPGLQMAAGSAAAIVFVPASLYLGEWVGGLSNNYFVAAVSGLLCIGLIPPIAITIATVLAGNWNAPGRYRWWPALLVTMVINGASLALGAWAGLSVGLVNRVVIYSLIQAVLQPGAATLVERAWPKQPPPAVLSSRDPISGSTYFVPMSSGSF